MPPVRRGRRNEHARATSIASSHSSDRPVRIALCQDDGPGLDEKQRAHLFSPLFADNGADSAGRGLATVYGIVKQSEGFIWADGAPGTGTSFRIYFPRLT